MLRLWAPKSGKGSGGGTQFWRWGPVRRHRGAALVCLSTVWFVCPLFAKVVFKAALVSSLK